MKGQDDLIFVSPFCSTSPEIIGVKVCHRWTDRQTNFLTPYMGVCGFFLSVKFATSLLASLAGGYLLVLKIYYCTNVKIFLLLLTSIFFRPFHVIFEVEKAALILQVLNLMKTLGKGVFK